jgi:hypothetical protein
MGIGIGRPKQHKFNLPCMLTRCAGLCVLPACRHCIMRTLAHLSFRRNSFERL